MQQPEGKAQEIEPNPNAQYWKQSVGQLPKSPPEIRFLEFRDEFLPFLGRSSARGNSFFLVIFFHPAESRSGNPNEGKGGKSPFGRDFLMGLFLFWHLFSLGRFDCLR